MFKILIILLIYFFFRNIRKILKKREGYYKWKKYESMTIRIFNLGSSHSEESFKRSKSLNLANSGQTIYYDYLLLDKYLKKIENKGICFLTVSYFSFGTRKLDKKHQLERYLYILKFKNFIGKDKLYYIIYNYIPLIKKYFRLPSVVGVSVEERIKTHHKILTNLKYLENRKENIKYLEQIIERCQEKNIRVILLTTPFMKEYNDYFSNEDLENNFYSIIRNIVNKYNVEYIDFSHEYDIFSERDDFCPGDYDHLSEKGSAKFVKELEKRTGIKLGAQY